VLGGHYHQSKVDRFRGIPFVQLPSPAPNGLRQVMVLRIVQDRVLAIPYDYRDKKWIEDPRRMLNDPIRRELPAADSR
jgi:hypothetical protein